MKRILLGLVSAGLLSTPLMVAAPAQAADTHVGPFTKKAKCVKKENLYRHHGYTVTVSCRRSAGGVGSWWFDIA